MKKQAQRKLALSLAILLSTSGIAFAEETSTVTTGPIASGTVITVDGQSGIEASSDITGGDNISITMTNGDNGLNNMAAINTNKNNITLGDNLTVTASAVTSPTGSYSAVALQAIGTTISVTPPYVPPNDATLINSTLTLGSSLNITVTGNDSLALYATANGLITGTGVYNIKGNILVDDPDYDNILNAGSVNLTFQTGSVFEGDITSYAPINKPSNLNFIDSQFTGTAFGSAINIFLTNSTWTLTPGTGHISIGNLIMDNGIVDLTTIPGDYPVFTTNEELSGSGTFKIKLEVGSSPADYKYTRIITPEDSTGNFILALNPVIQPGAVIDPNRLYPVWALGVFVPSGLEQPPAGLNVSLAYDVDMGPYQFELSGVNPWNPPPGYVAEARNGWDYVLKHKGYSTAVKTTPNASRAMYFLNYAEMNTLLQRMGDLRQTQDKGDVWARVFSGEFKIDATDNFNSFNQKYTGVQVGIDKKIKSSDKADFYLGAMFGYTQGDNDYLQRSSGDTISYYGGIYGLYNEPKNNFFIDSILKFGSMKNEMNLWTNGQIATSDDNANTWSFSVETGKRFFLNKEKRQNQEGFYLEPQLQFVYGNIGSTEYNFNGTNLNVDSIKSKMMRLGLLIGHEIKSYKNPVNIYGKVSWVKEFDDNLNTVVDGVRVGSKMNDNWFTYGIGITTMINNKHNLYLELQRSSGGQFTQNWQINGGYRYTF